MAVLTLGVGHEPGDRNSNNGASNTVRRILAESGRQQKVIAAKPRFQRSMQQPKRQPVSPLTPQS